MKNETDFLPLLRAWNRVEIDLHDSEASAFYSLLYLGEAVVKLTAAAFTAGVQEDPDRRGYAAAFRLIRGSGVGEHAAVLDEILVGPTYEVLSSALRPLQQEITGKFPETSWQRKAVASMNSALLALEMDVSGTAQTASLRSWFQDFARIRNKTRGHGAHRTETISECYPHLRESLEYLTSDFSLFRLPWAYIRRNLSGRYRVIPFGATEHEVFEKLRSSGESTLQDGVYMVAENSAFNVKLCISDADLSDFFLPNGSYTNGRCEFISLITGNSKEVDASDYSAPTTALPGSETDGAKELHVVGSIFSNVPPRPNNYVSRPVLEKDLCDALRQGRHEIITLAGPGGAGKTSLALEACHALAKEEPGRFSAIIWFSARDIDLLPSGPKTVKPQGVTLKDFAKAYVELLAPSGRSQKGFKAEDYMAGELGNASAGASLFVFDNFETVGSQEELFNWVDSYVRSPNKVLITTRTREFSGDKPIIVKGMTYEEAKELIENTCKRYGISGSLTAANIEELIRESGGHPYVLKIMLGEIASRNAYVAPQRIIADEERMLGALFERTFSRLSPVGQLLFLVLSSWKSAIPFIALEATLLHHAPERVDVHNAADELLRASLVDEISTGNDKVQYLSVPLAALAFGRKKFATSSYRALVEKCVETLHLFGATTAVGLKQSLDQALLRFIHAIQRKLENDQIRLDEIRPMFEFLASAAPNLWISLERLVAQVEPENLRLRGEYLKRYIEASASGADLVSAWRSLANILGRLGDTEGEVLAYGEIARLPDSTLSEVSEAANRLNNTFKAKQTLGTSLSGYAKRETIQRVIDRLESDFPSLTATDLSRLAWLYLNIGKENDAERVAIEGGRREPDNDYCCRLLDKLQRHSESAPHQ